MTPTRAPPPSLGGLKPCRSLSPPPQQGRALPPNIRGLSSEGGTVTPAVGTSIRLSPTEGLFFHDSFTDLRRARWNGHRWKSVEFQLAIHSPPWRHQSPSTTAWRGCSLAPPPSPVVLPPPPSLLLSSSVDGNQARHKSTMSRKPWVVISSRSRPPLDNLVQVKGPGCRGALSHGGRQRGGRSGGVGGEVCARRRVQGARENAHAARGHPSHQWGQLHRLLLLGEVNFAEERFDEGATGRSPSCWARSSLR
jgi:hypothetical protein